jgi:hypothetical protein
MSEINNRETDNFEKELAQAASKRWTIEYEGNEIVIINEMNSEQLLVNDECIAENTRTNFLSTLKPFQTLNGSFQNINGGTSFIEVKIGGFITLNLRLKVDDVLIYKDKINIFR